MTLGILVPMILIGAWTSRRLERAGRDLLRSELESQLAGIERLIARVWPVRRGELTLLAENNVVPGLVTDSRRLPTSEEQQFLQAAMAQLGADVTEVIWADSTGAPRWRLGLNPGRTMELTQVSGPGETPRSHVGQLAVSLPIADGLTDKTYGTLIAAIRPSTLIPSNTVVTVPSATVRLIDVETMTPVLVIDGVVSAETITDAPGDTVAISRRIPETPLMLEAAAPAALYVAPFGNSARNGTILTLLVATLATGVASVITARVTKSLGELSTAADAVARGDFDRQIDVRSNDELGRVASAFNSMTRDLRRSVQESAERRSLAAVGEFAAELAHEVRNPLTAVRLDLQRLNERLPSDGDLRDRMRRILAVVDRLNRTVTGSLRVARSGSVTLRSVPLSAALDPAIEAAMPEFQARGVSLLRDGVDPRTVSLKADADALTQLFLNLFLNGAQAIDNAGTVSLVIHRRGSDVQVVIADTGRGMPPDVLERVHRRLQSTKSSGTGLGLTIARRIADAHGGTIDFASRERLGTTVTVTLPGSVLSVEDP